MGPLVQYWTCQAAVTQQILRLLPSSCVRWDWKTHRFIRHWSLSAPEIHELATSGLHWRCCSDPRHLRRRTKGSRQALGQRKLLGTSAATARRGDVTDGLFTGKKRFTSYFSDALSPARTVLEPDAPHFAALVAIAASSSAATAARFISPCAIHIDDCDLQANSMILSGPPTTEPKSCSTRTACRWTLSSTHTTTNCGHCLCTTVNHVLVPHVLSSVSSSKTQHTTPGG